MPTPMQAGEVIGWDLKKVKVSGAEPWVMLLAVDFTSQKVWAWDLDVGAATLENVYGLIIRFQHEHELSSVNYCDNGGQFRHVLAAALERAFGVKPMHTPPSRPQVNGLVKELLMET